MVFVSFSNSKVFGELYRKPKHQEDSSGDHTDTQTYKRSQNEDVTKVVEIFDDVFVDPFTMSNCLLRLLNFA